MFLKVSASGEVSSRTATIFERSSLSPRASRASSMTVRGAVAGKAELPDAQTAWVFEDALRRWPGVADNADWQSKLSAMIEKARPHGWIDDARKAIKAHVEWVA